MLRLHTTEKPLANPEENWAEKIPKITMLQKFQSRSLSKVHSSWALLHSRAVGLLWQFWRPKRCGILANKTSNTAQLKSKSCGLYIFDKGCTWHTSPSPSGAATCPKKQPELVETNSCLALNGLVACRQANQSCKETTNTAVCLNNVTVCSSDKAKSTRWSSRINFCINISA